MSSEERATDGVFLDEAGKNLLQLFVEMGTTLNNIDADLVEATAGMFAVLCCCRVV